MAPAANDSKYDPEIVFNHNVNPSTAFSPVDTADVKDSLLIARAMIEQRRQQNTTEEKIAAIVAARRSEVRKERELELARLLSLQRERELFQRDPELLAMAVSAGEHTSFRSETALRLRSVFQRNQHDEMSLLQSTNGRGKEDDTLYQPGSSRILPLPGFEVGLLSLPSQSPPLSTPSLSSRTSVATKRSAFLESQISVLERLHGITNSHFNRTDFNSDRSHAILNSLYSSRSNLQVPSIYCNDNTGTSNLDTMNINRAMPTTSLLSGAHAGVGSNWLRSAAVGGIVNSAMMGISSGQDKKHGLEESDAHFVGSKRVKTTDQGNSNGSEPEGEQQQKRFNKHQCKQWTLKFHELLAFKERMGHCNVPHGYKDNLPLAMWVKRQRHQYNLMVEKKTSTLTGERIKLLENIGFVWNCLETAWEQHFQDLRHFVMRTGHCAVPSTYKRNPRLASWVVTQRRQCKLLEDGKQSSMTPKRLEKLRKIGFPVTTKKSSSNKNLNK